MPLPNAALLALGLAPAAQAESAAVLPAGGKVLYAGAGLNTYSRLRFADGSAADDGQLDRATRSRLDLYAASGLGTRFQVSAWLPVVRSTVPESGFGNDGRGPCPSSDDFCEPILSVGTAGLQGRAQLLRQESAPLDLSAGLALQSDLWNADVRSRYTAFGDGTVDLQPALYAGRGVALGATRLGLLGWGAYSWRRGRVIAEGSAGPFRAPGDDLRGGVELRVDPQGPLAVELGGRAYRRLWGLDWDGAYQSEYWPTQDRWTSLWYRDLALGGKLSVDLPRDLGLHLGAYRVVAVRNGPPDSWDLTLGVHRWFAPRGPKA
jgi:hypothetical protein